MRKAFVVSRKYGGDTVWNVIPFKYCVHIHLHTACTLTMCYVLITMIFVFLFFCHYIDYLCVSLCCCGRVCLCTWPSFLFFLCAWYMSVCPSLCVCMRVCVCINVLSHHLPMPPIRVPGGECRQWCCTGGHWHPRDQCDRCERRANAQRRLPAATPWWPRPAWLRHIGRCLWGQPGPPRSWLQHAGSGGQEAEVCETDGGEWGFWVGLHREEPVLRSCPSFPLPHSRGNLGNCVWGRGLKSCMMTSPFTSCAELHQPLFA